MDSKDILTRKQKLLIKELKEIFSLLRLDYQNIKDYDKEWRTAALEHVKNKAIRGAVILDYTLIDEHLNHFLCKYFFPKNKSYIYLWKTKKFRSFNYYILEELHLLQKLRFVKSILKMPKDIVADIERMNSLRNGLAHAFFPENLKKSRPEWKGKNIFTLEGIKLFNEDTGKIHDFLMNRLGK